MLVKGAVDQLNDLIRTVNGFDLQHGIQTSLDAKLQNAVSALTSAHKNDVTTACNAMAAFVNSVTAQTGQAIPTSRAAGWISAAKQIETTLGCPK